MKWEVDDLFGVNEDDIQLKEVRVVKEEIKIGKILEAIELGDRVSESKETKRIGK